MTVLILEDDHSIRAIIRAVLTNRSYRVLEATDTDEAVSVSDQHRGPLQVLIADVMLKAPNGVETSQRMLSSRPELRVLFVSGYSVEQFKDRLAMLPSHRVRFLHK